MNKYFELTIRHYDMETKFINCSVDNAVGILQTDMHMRGIDIDITIAKFWDMVFDRPCLNNELHTLLVKRDIVIKRR